MIARRVPEPIEELGRAELTSRILQSHRRLRQAISERNPPGWLGLGIPPAQLRALFVLRGCESISLGDLAAQLGIKLSAASQLVERLVQHGLVDRREDPRDRRRLQMQLSTQGRAIDACYQAGAEARLRTWLACLDDPDLVALDQGLRALAGAANAARPLGLIEGGARTGDYSPPGPPSTTRSGRPGGTAN